MTEILAVLAALLAIAGLSAAVLLVGTFFIVRGAVRRTRRTRFAQTVCRGTMVATSMAQLRSAAIPLGSRGEIGRLRLRLQSDLRHTERVLNSAVITGTGPNPFADLLPPLKHTSAQLDRYLALVEREPDPVLRQAQLPRLLSRAEAVIADSTALRGAAYGLADVIHTTTAEPLIADIRDRIVGLLLAVNSARAGT